MDERAIGLEAVIFDWAGTLVDFGSFAPTRVLVDACAHFGLDLTLEQARGPMGVAKREHIAALLRMPGIAAQFRRLHGRDPADADVDEIYRTFLPWQEARAADYSDPVPGVPELLAALRGRGLAIGSCSGYPRRVLDRVLARAAERGVAVDCAVACDEVPRARPSPAMALRNAVELAVADVAGCVKVDDTAPGIREGRAAGMWTVGLLLSGNAAGLTVNQWRNLDEPARAALRGRARHEFDPARPHYLIDTAADLLPVLDDIAVRLAAGARPQATAPISDW